MSISPKVSWDGDRLLARTSLVWQVLLLGSWRKDVTVDPHARTVTLSWQYLWGLRRERTIGFDEISHVEYRYGGSATSTGWRSRDPRNRRGGRVETWADSYTIALALRDGSEAHLFTFSGESPWSAPEQSARSYLDALSAATGKGLSKLLSSSLDSRMPVHDRSPAPVPASAPLWPEPRPLEGSTSGIDFAMAAPAPAPPHAPHEGHGRCAVHGLGTGPDGRCVLCRRASGW
jgi:hypothetical protein